MIIHGGSEEDPGALLLRRARQQAERARQHADERIRVLEARLTALESRTKTEPKN